jgi:transaldolase/glucose-6-phosphate isomerase
MVDGLITGRLATTAADARPGGSPRELLGTVAIANAKLAYQRYLAIGRSTAWQRLAASGARPQRLLWAGTSTTNPAYRDVRYVEELIGRDTVTTLTPATLEAFRDHGRLRASLDDNLDGARASLAALERTGISLDDVADRLLEDGITLLSKAFEGVLAAINHRRRSAVTAGRRDIRPHPAAGSAYAPRAVAASPSR